MTAYLSEQHLKNIIEAYSDHSTVFKKLLQPKNADLIPIVYRLIETTDWSLILLNEQLLCLLINQNNQNNKQEVVKFALRRLRLAYIIALAIQDYQKTPLIRVMQNMSLFADWALSIAVKQVGLDLSQRYGMPIHPLTQEPIDLQVVAMGKLGGYELNISSDIDIVFLIPYIEGDTQGVPVQGVLRQSSNNEFIQAWAKQVVLFLSQVNDAGFVFRVDTMLRPYGSAGPLVLSHDSLEHYLLCEGRMWERLAWLKARPVFTPCFLNTEQHQTQHQAWQRIVEPFVYRRYLDFTVLESLRLLHRKIRQERQSLDNNPHHGLHLKLARGGIRELEFWVQGQQLIRAGRNPSLRGKDTLSTLQAFVQAGLIDNTQADRLSSAYIVLRRAEHAVQWVNDTQTHTLPYTQQDRLWIAQIINKHNDINNNTNNDNILNEFDNSIHTIMLSIAQLFDDLFYEVDSFNNDNSSSNNYNDNNNTFINIKDVLSDIDNWTGLNDSIRLSITHLIQLMFNIINKKNDTHIYSNHHLKSTVFNRLIQLIKTISKRKTYLDLLLAYPTVLNRVIDLMATTPFAAHYLQLHPALIDELIDSKTLYTPLDEGYWNTEETRLLTRLYGLDEETQLHVLCETHHAWVLRIIFQDQAQHLGGQLTILGVSDALSKAADIILNAVLCCVNYRLNQSFSIPAGLAVIAYGKLGGKELGYGSDLDVVFIVDKDLIHPFSDPLEEPLKDYTRIVQRTLSWLSLKTAAGRLFEMDTALRPNGISGGLLSTVESFSDYQIGNSAGTHAWVWEHQAISRARVCAGDMRLNIFFNQLRHQVLCLNREPKTLKQTIIDMRDRILKDKESLFKHQNNIKNNINDINDKNINYNTIDFNPKYIKGGMIDIEFMVQYAVLLYTKTYPQLNNNIGNIGLLNLMASSMIGLISQDTANELIHRYTVLRTIQHHQYLNQDTF